MHAAGNNFAVGVKCYEKIENINYKIDKNHKNYIVSYRKLHHFAKSTKCKNTMR